MKAWRGIPQVRGKKRERARSDRFILMKPKGFDK
jgi:hypothetical protein